MAKKTKPPEPPEPPEPSEPPVLVPLRSFPFEDLYAAVARSDIAEALDLVYQTVDQALSDGCFADVDAWCANVDVNRLNTHTMFAWLFATMPAVQKLPHHQSLFDCVQARFIREESRLSPLLRSVHACAWPHNPLKTTNMRSQLQQELHDAVVYLRGLATRTTVEPTDVAALIDLALDLERWLLIIPDETNTTSPPRPCRSEDLAAAAAELAYKSRLIKTE